MAPSRAAGGLLLLLACCGGALAEQRASRRMQQPTSVEYATNRVIVRLKRSPGPGKAAALGTAQGVKILQTKVGTQGAEVWQIVDGTSVADKIKQLQLHPDVAAVEPDYKVYVSQVTSNDPISQWHLPKIAAPAAWSYTTGSPTVKVCHIDSGVRVDHADLAANVLKGWNLVPPGQTPGDPAPTPADPAYLAYNDTLGHGTHTAGLIGAVGNNGVGVAGVSWTVKLLVCRFVWDDGAGFLSDAMTCLRLCAQEGAMISSNSWGGTGYSAFLHDELEAAMGRGQLFVVAGGNGGQDLDAAPQYPASYGLPNVLSVASTDQDDTLSGFSNWGESSTGVDVAAPGEDLFSTCFDGGYCSMTGTSMAAPLVAGLAALLQAQAQAAGITLTYQQLAQFITQSADKLPQLDSRLKAGGRVNAARAAQAMAEYLESLGVQPAITGLITMPSPSLSPPPPSPSSPVQLRAISSPASSPQSLSAAPAISGPSAMRLVSKLPCGTSRLRDARAWQSSTAKRSSNACGLGSTAAQAYTAGRAVDGKCQRQWTAPLKGSCSITGKQDNPWWQAELRRGMVVRGVGLTTRSDCNWQELAGAQILLGPRAYAGDKGSVPLTAFSLCATVPASVPRGQRMTFDCAAGQAGQAARYLLVRLPKKNSRLALCEVDVITESW